MKFRLMLLLPCFTTFQDVIRCWVKDHPVKAERLTAGSPAKAILSKEPTVTANFELHPDANPASRKKGLLRWVHHGLSQQGVWVPFWTPKPVTHTGVLPNFLFMLKNSVIFDPDIYPC